MEKIKNLSIRKTIILYMTINIIISFFLSTIIVNAATNYQQKIWAKYVDWDNFLQERSELDQLYLLEIPRISNADMTRLDLQMSEICDFLETWSILIISFLGSIISVFMFYKHKIKEPVKELVSGSKMISENKLDFNIDYINEDELGILCAEFERMRKQLLENNKQLWKMVEQEKALRYAIAHDIRSPLSIMRGYQEMLLEFMPEEKLEKDKVMEILQSGMSQIDRLNAFVETMRQISKLEDREINYHDIELDSLKAEIKNNAIILSKNAGIECEVFALTKNRNILVDSMMVIEVINNLLSNAVRFAKLSVRIEMSLEANELHISIKDDGSGFQDDVENVTKAYYHSNPQDDLNNFGLGLYISRVYCEKHGGKLLIGNQMNGGAEVKAIFQVK